LLDLKPGEQLAVGLEPVLRRLCAPEAQRVQNALAASRSLRACERLFLVGGALDGVTLASKAVYAAVDREPPRGPAADVGGDAFAKYARSTYMGTDDDISAEFNSSDVATVAAHPLGGAVDAIDAGALVPTGDVLANTDELPRASGDDAIATTLPLGVPAPITVMSEWAAVKANVFARVPP